MVEGDSDSRLFKKFIEPEWCSVTVCHSKQNLIDAIEILFEDGALGIIGICDKDFDDILGIQARKDCIFFTDENDLEIMILASTALQSVLIEYAVNDKIKELEEKVGKQIREQIFETASFIGALRLISLRKSWELKFEGMTYKFENNSFKLNEFRTVQHILGRSSKRPDITEESLLELVKAEQEKCYDRRKICCGHDCTRVLGRALNKNIGSTNVFDKKGGSGSLEKVLRTAYSNEQFSQTILFKDILSWESQSGYEILQKD